MIPIHSSNLQLWSHVIPTSILQQRHKYYAYLPILGKQTITIGGTVSTIYVGPIFIFFRPKIQGRSIKIPTIHMETFIFQGRSSSPIWLGKIKFMFQTTNQFTSSIKPSSHSAAPCCGIICTALGHRPGAKETTPVSALLWLRRSA